MNYARAILSRDGRIRMPDAIIVPIPLRT